MAASEPDREELAGEIVAAIRQARLDEDDLAQYLSDYRNEGHFCQALAVKIRDDVAAALQLDSNKVRVTLTQKARGGISITARS